MIQISLPYVIEFVASLDRLSNVVAGRKIIDVYGHVYHAKSQIDQFYQESLYAPALRSSRELSASLSKNLGDVMAIDLQKEIATWQQWNVSNSRDQFRTAFLAELGVMPSYFVTQKGGFDTLTLLSNASALFPASLGAKCPETAADVAQMGSALAFDLGTAAGFHLFRILEAVLRRYYSLVTSGQAPPKVRSIGAYVRAIRKAGCGEEKILATLDQIRDLHRNPLVHPEFLATTEQAVTMLGIVRSAIEPMLEQLTVPMGPGGLASMFSNPSGG
jgi:hypothetical protein